MRSRSFLATAGLLVLVLVAYVPVFAAGAIWDDDSYLTDNPLVRTGFGLVRIWLSPTDSPQYYPVVFTSFWLEYHLWGLNYSGYHAVNVLLHGLNAVLVWRVLRRLDVPGAWVAAAIFGLHPVHVESVAWITERKNVLSGLFYLSALLAYLRFAPLAGEPGDGSERVPAQRWVWYLLAFACYVAALGSKTVTSSLPAAILLLVWWKRGRIAVGDVLPLVPFFATGLSASALTAWLEVNHVGARGPEWAFSAQQRCLIAGRALWFYAGKLAWPANLTFSYPRWRIDASLWRPYGYPLAVVALVAALWFAQRRIGRGVLAAVWFFCGTLVPALGFFNIYPMRYSFVADHFQYLASLGLIACATALGARLALVLRMPAWGRVACAGGMLFVLGWLTLMRVPAFVSAPAIWQDTLEKNPTSVIANHNLGQFYRERYELDKARRYIEAALRTDPGCTQARYNLASVLEQQGDLPGAERELLRTLRDDPADWRSLFAIGMIRKRQGRTAEAIAHFRATLRFNPTHEDARKQLELIEHLPGTGLRPASGGKFVGARH